MRSIISFVLTLSIFISSAPTVSADTVSMETKIVELQEYLARTIDSNAGTPLSDTELRTLIKTGAAWLVNAQQPNGRFRYEFFPYEDRYGGDDNIVRQTGALFALTEILRHDKTDTLHIAKTAHEAITHFERISKKGEQNGQSFRCITVNSASTKCELGATALALASIIGYVEHAPANTSEVRDLISDYRAFILAMQKRNGGFQNSYLIGRSSQSDAESPFSNGEALLALTRLYNYKSDSEVKDAIEEALAYLVEQPYDSALYLWIMAALKEVDDIDVRLQNTAYVRDFTLWRLEHGAALHNSNKNFCAYTEGLVSALSLLKDRVPQNVYDRVQREVEFGLRKNRALQVTDNDVTRAFIGTNGLEIISFTRPLRAVGGFLTGEAERSQRIDYTQHCVNAYVQMIGDVRGLSVVER